MEARNSREMHSQQLKHQFQVKRVSRQNQAKISREVMVYINFNFEISEKIANTVVDEC